MVYAGLWKKTGVTGVMGVKEKMKEEGENGLLRAPCLLKEHEHTCFESTKNFVLWES